MSAYPPFIFQTAVDAYLNAVKGAIKTVHLVKDYLPADSFATKTTTKSVANISIAAEDMSITEISGVDKLVINPKSNLAKTINSTKYIIDVATGGGVNSMIQTGAGWTINEHERRVVHIVSGTGAGQSAKIASNTADTLTLEQKTVGYNNAVAILEDAFAIAPDNTSNFEVMDDIWAVYVSDTEEVYAIDETTDKAISAASGDQVSVSGTAIGLPDMVAVSA